MRFAVKLVVPLVVVTAVVAAPRSARDGVFSPAQVQRGQRGYLAHCARCHGETLLGGENSPPLVEGGFLNKWHGLSVGLLVERTRLTMPSDGPGKLSRQLCTDIVAYLLRENGFPEGTGELESNLATLNEVFIHPKE